MLVHQVEELLESVLADLLSTTMASGPPWEKSLTSQGRQPARPRQLRRIPPRSSWVHCQAPRRSQGLWSALSRNHPLVTSKVAPERALIHWPLMYAWSLIKRDSALIPVIVRMKESHPAPTYIAQATSKRARALPTLESRGRRSADLQCRGPRLRVNLGGSVACLAWSLPRDCMHLMLFPQGSDRLPCSLCQRIAGRPSCL